MRTFGTQLVKTRGRPAGFDYMRLSLAVAVIAFHSILVSYGRSAETAVWEGPLGPLLFTIVPAFFALSGFLVAGSLQRNDLPSFLTLRALRIFPALCVEVVLSAALIGSLFTTLPLSAYVSSPMFHAYFLNILGDVHFFLPGVFEQLPAPGLVNLQLWTVPIELRCYIALSLLAVARIHKRPVLFIILVIVASIAAFAHGLVSHHLYPGYGGPRQTFLILAFLSGVGLYNLRDHILFSWPIAVLAAAIVYLVLSHPPTVYFAILPISYMTVFLGLCDPPRTSVVRGADYSYGMYLYGFVIQQSISFLLPATRVWYLNLALSVVVAACFAAFSWHIIEKRVLGRKKEAVRLARALALSHPALRKLCQWDVSWGAETPGKRAETTP